MGQLPKVGNFKLPHALLTTLLNRYFRKFETFVPHPDYPDVDPSTRGSSGPVKVGYFNTITENSKAFVESCIKLGIPYNPDFNGPQNTGGVSRVCHFSSLPCQVT